jgi:hypothetical protein
MDESTDSVAIDAYVSVKNENNHNVLNRIASSTIKLFNVGNIDMINGITEEVRGSFHIKFIGNQSIVRNKSDNKTTPQVYEHFKRIENTVNTDAYQNRKVLNNMTPIDSFIKNVHAPFFQTRFGIKLPGYSFWMHEETLNVTENFYDHLMKNMYWRYCNSYKDTNNLSDIDKVMLFFTGVSSIIQSYPYISDTTYSVILKRQKPYESFDNYFVRRGGDCEDSSKAIVQLVRTFQKMHLINYSLKSLQKLIQQYIPFSILSMVTNNSAKNWNANNSNNKLAHMSCQMIPKFYFYQMIANCSRNNTQQKQYALQQMSKCSPHFTSFRLEGTAVTVPLSYDQNIVINSTVLPSKINTDSYSYIETLQSCPAIKNMSDHPFYKIDTHIYSSPIEGLESGIFSFMSKKNTQSWGKTFRDTLSHDEDVVLWCHPISNFKNVIKEIKIIVSSLHPSPALTVDKKLLSLHKIISSTNFSEKPCVGLCPIIKWLSFSRNLSEKQKQHLAYNIEGFDNISAKSCFKF